VVTAQSIMIHEISASPHAGRRSLSAEATEAAETPVPVIGALPQSLVFTERAVARLRAFLAGRGDGHFRIFHSPDLGVDDVEDHLAALGESAAWEPLGALSGGEPLSRITHGRSGARIWPGGVLRLARHGV